MKKIRAIDRPPLTMGLIEPVNGGHRLRGYIGGRRRLVLIGLEIEDIAGKTDETPLDVIDRKKRKVWVSGAIRKLTAEEREIIIRVFYWQHEPSPGEMTVLEAAFEKLREFSRNDKIAARNPMHSGD